METDKRVERKGKRQQNIKARGGEGIMNDAQ